MTVLITLTTAGADTGPFNLFSDANGYTTAFNATPVSKAELLAGYPSDTVPDATTIIKVVSLGDCVNSLYITLSGVTTTTTTTLQVFTQGLDQSSAYCVGGFCEFDGTITGITVYSLDEVLITGSYIYIDPALTIPYTTELVSDGQYIFNVSSLGELTITCTVGIEC